MLPSPFTLQTNINGATTTFGGKNWGGQLHFLARDVNIMPAVVEETLGPIESRFALGPGRHTKAKRRQPT